MNQIRLVGEFVSLICPLILSVSKYLKTAPINKGSDSFVLLFDKLNLLDCTNIFSETKENNLFFQKVFIEIQYLKPFPSKENYLVTIINVYPCSSKALVFSTATVIKYLQVCTDSKT
jgi:hypothetical protein